MDGMMVNPFNLTGGQKHGVSEFVGKIIAAVEMPEADPQRDKFLITFEDGIQICISDKEQSCCEERYITCDDDPKSLIGGELRRIESKKGPTIGDDDDIHEQCFIEIGTDKTFITLCTHNEHNGGYGGFTLDVEIVEKA